MDVLEAIASRRMLPRVGAQRPTRAEIEDLLALAVRAPSHHLTEPWRFYVLAGHERDRLARAVAAEDAESNGTDPDEALDAARKKVDRAPVIVACTCVPSPDAVEQEELASVAMAIQNVLLAAPAKGLGVMLRTGAASYHPAMAAELGLDDGEVVVGLLYIGYPEADRSLTPRTPASEKTTWLGWGVQGGSGPGLRPADPLV